MPASRSLSSRRSPIRRLSRAGSPLFAADLFAVCEMPCPMARADLMAMMPRAQLTIVRIKVAKADLIGD